VKWGTITGGQVDSYKMKRRWREGKSSNNMQQPDGEIHTFCM